MPSSIRARAKKSGRASSFEPNPTARSFAQSTIQDMLLSVSVCRLDNVSRRALVAPLLGQATFLTTRGVSCRLLAMDRVVYGCSTRPNMIVPCPQARSFATNNDSEQQNEPTRSRRRRRRHNFDLRQVPSFEAFQQQQTIRSLYRQFLRLAYNSPSSKEELIDQMRREFRQDIANDDPWAKKRALSEANAKLKQVSAMLSSVPGRASIKGQNDKDDDNEGDDDYNNSSNSSNAPGPSAWPWQGGGGSNTPSRPSRPLGFPKR